MERAEHLAAVLAERPHLEHVFPVDPHGQAHRDFAAAGLRLQRLLESRVDIAVEGGSLAQVRHVLAADLQALADVSPETGHPVGRGKGETVAVAELQVPPEGLDAESHRSARLAADALHRPDGLAHRLGRIHRRPFAAPPVQEKFRITPVEGLVRIGHESPGDLPVRRAAVALGVFRHQGVQGQGIVPHHVLHVGGVLEPPFDLEGRDPGIGEFLQPGLQIIVPQGQDRFVAEQHAAVSVHEVIQRAARLDALAAVGAPAVEVLRQAALAAVARAERPVHEELHLAAHGGADLPDLFQRELPLQDDAFAAQRLEQPGPLHVADGALGGGVQGDGDVGPGGDPGFPDDERVRARLLGEEHLRVGLLLLPVPPQGIVSNEDTHTEAVRVGTKFRDVVEAVARRLARPEIRACDIYGIGTAVDGCDADFLVPGGSQQLKTLHYLSASSIFLASAPYLGSPAALV